MAHIIGLLLPETPGLDNGGIDAQADQVIAYRECPALAQGQDMHGCGGASPFADFNGGGSAPGVDEKWAPGGQWTTRTAQEDFVPAVGRMQAKAEEENPTRDSAENAEGAAPAQSGHASPAYLSQRDAMQGCGGAAPFATFHGSGSVGDQSQYAPGGQWTYRN